MVVCEKFGSYDASSNNVLIVENRNALSCVIDCVKYLAQEMIALLGHESHGGKLYNLFRLLSKYNRSAAAYVERIDRAHESGKRMATNFLSPSNVQKLLSVMKVLITEKIVGYIDQQKKFSIIADGTYDSSKKEATVLLLRYVEMDENGTPQPAERLINVFCSGDSSGARLCELILDSLRASSIHIEWVVEQGYDGAGNVRGKYKGLKTKIQEIKPKALYIWCHGHRFNLAMEATVSCCPEIRNALGLLEELYVFFSGHKRNSIFLDAQHTGGQKRQLQRVACTRWNSRQAAVDTTIQCYSAVLSSLDTLASTGDDSATVSGARGLRERLRDFRFIITLFLLKEVFDTAGPVSRQLQGICVDLAMAAKLILNCRTKFETMRRESNVDATWNLILERATSFAGVHNIDVHIDERRKKRRMMDGEVCSDETRNGLERIRLDMFVPVLDQICMQLRDRFDDDTTALLTEMSLFATSNLKQGSSIAVDDIVQLTSLYGLDSDAIVLEYGDFCEAFSTLNDHRIDTHPQTLRTSDRRVEGTGDVCENATTGEETDTGSCEITMWNLHNFVKPLQACYQLSGYPNLLQLYWILVTLPVTSCSAERALSRLRIIKNRLRSTMCDDWMNALMVISAEKDLLSSINHDIIIDRFARLSDQLKRNLIHV